jgi:hypothetical protein
VSVNNYQNNLVTGIEMASSGEFVAYTWRGGGLITFSEDETTSSKHILFTLMADDPLNAGKYIV